MNNRFNTDYTNERIYHKLVEEYFERNKIKYLSKPKIPVYSKESGKKIGCYEPDFLIANVIILELKALPFVSGREEKQLVEYVKISPYEIAYLVNFGTEKLYYERIIYTNDRKNLLSTPKEKSSV